MAPETREPHLPSLVAGIGLIAVGAALLLDALDVIDLDPTAIWPALLALVGAALLAGGVQQRRRTRR
jgi:drug/metabolite transporter (DMT)-like permease